MPRISAPTISTSTISTPAIRRLVPVAVALLALTPPAATSARAASLADMPLVGGWFGAPNKQTLPMTEAELSSLGCIGFSLGAVAFTVVFGGAAAVVTGGAAPASVVAAPVLAGVAAAGCALGSAAAPGLAWLNRNRDALAAQLGESLPAAPALPGVAR